MYVLYLFAAYIAVAFATVLGNLGHTFEVRTGAYDQANTQAIGVVISAANTFQHNNPTASGDYSAASLGAPSWFTPGSVAAGAVLQTGTAYVYLDPTGPSEAAGMTAQLQSKGFVTGIARGNAIYTAGGGLVAAIPAGIPSGAVVVIQ